MSCPLQAPLSFAVGARSLHLLRSVDSTRGARKRAGPTDRAGGRPRLAGLARPRSRSSGTFLR